LSGLADCRELSIFNIDVAFAVDVKVDTNGNIYAGGATSQGIGHELQSFWKAR
jgi:hypothetical protein